MRDLDREKAVSLTRRTIEFIIPTTLFLRSFLSIIPATGRDALYKWRRLWCVQRVKSLHGLSLSPRGLKFKTSRKLNACTCVYGCGVLSEISEKTRDKGIKVTPL